MCRHSYLLELLPYELFTTRDYPCFHFLLQVGTSLQYQHYVPTQRTPKSAAANISETPSLNRNNA
jgi:hypothetical protein